MKISIGLISSYPLQMLGVFFQDVFNSLTSVERKLFIFCRLRDLRLMMMLTVTLQVFLACVGIFLRGDCFVCLLLITRLTLHQLTRSRQHAD